GMENAEEILGSKVKYCEDAYDTAEDCDALAILTEWNQFRKLNIPRLKDILKEPVIIDTRNIYDPGGMKGLGIRYTSVGRLT
ncbi:MAG: UDP binding domain-containing protein, partial [Thermodesulfobacteriota bacterium]